MNQSKWRDGKDLQSIPIACIKVIVLTWDINCFLFMLLCCVWTVDGLVSSAPVYILHWVSPLERGTSRFNGHASAQGTASTKSKETKTNRQWLAPEPQTYILKTYHPLQSPSPEILKIPSNFFLGSFLVHKREAFPLPLPRVWRCNEIRMRWITRGCFNGSLTFRHYGSDVTETDSITNALRLQVQTIFRLRPVAAFENSSQIYNII